MRHDIIKWLSFLAMLVIIGCSGGGLISGHFVLSQNSPPPAWFTSDQGQHKFMIDIYETTFTTVGDVRIKVLDFKGKVVTQVKGKWEWHPATRARSATQYPKWSVIRIGNTAEIYEQAELTNVLTIVKSVPSNESGEAPNQSLDPIFKGSNTTL